MKGLMLDLGKALFIIFVCLIIFFWLALIFKFAVVMDRYQKPEADIAVRHPTEQIVTE